MSLRIVFVNEYFPPAVVGGAEVSTEEQAAALAALGHEITVLTPHYRGPRREESRGFRVVRFPFPFEGGAGREVNPLVFQNPLFYLYLAWWTWREARRADVIHVHNSFSLVGASLGARLARRPLAVTVRDYMHLCSAGAICLHDRDRPPHRCAVRQYRICFREFQRQYQPGVGRLRRMKASLRNLIETVDVKLRQRALFRADLVVTVSDAVGTIFEAAGLLGRPPSTVYNVPSPPRESPSKDASRGRWNIPPEAPIVLYVGKQSYGKGTDVLLDAARLVHREEPAVCFVLAGRTNSLIRVPQNDRFVVTGPLEHEEVLSLYAVADVVALPAVWKEPFPRSLIEAMSAARPVVASRTGGIPELVEDGETGLLVPPKDARALADALLLVLRSKETAEAMGERGKARLERWFEAESGAKSLCAAYSRILGTTSTTGMEAR